MAQYLDITGLSKYDELIKSLINKADIDLGKRIDAVVEDCGENTNSLAEIISKIGNVSDGSDAETIVDRLDELENGGGKYKPSQSLVDLNLTSSEHGGLGSHDAVWFKTQGYTYSQMFDEILFPTVQPTITNPSLTWDNYSTSYDKLVGTDITGLILTQDNIKNYINVSLGSWSLDINSEMTASNRYLPIKLTTTGDLVDNGDDTYSMGTDTIKYEASATFDKGNDPKDNKGNVCTGMGYDGGSHSTAAYIYPYYNFYATTNQNTPGELVLQTFIRKAGIDTITTKQGDIYLAPHTSDKPWKLRLPKKLQTLWILNTSNGKYEVIEMSGDAPKMWKYEQEIKKENGINYHVYTYIGSDNDPVNIQIKF